MAQQTNLLPPIYRQVEYIESTGTQWIDTGIVPNNTTQVDTLVETTSTAYDIPVFGVFVDDDSTNLSSISGYYHLTPYNAKWYYGGNGTEGNGGTYSNIIGEKYHALFNTSSHGIVINDISIVDGITFSSYSDYHLAIGFRGHVQNTYKRFGQWRYYYFKITNNETNEWISNLIPCVRLTDDKPGMYDLVRKIFLTNAGTGEFSTGTIAYEASNLSFDGTANTVIDTGVYLFTQENINRDFEFIAENIRTETATNDGNKTIICAKHNGNAYGFLVRLYASTSISYNGTIFVSPTPASITIKRIGGVITVSGNNIANKGVKFVNAVFNWPLVLGCAIADDGSYYRFKDGTIEHVLVRWLN